MAVQIRFLALYWIACHALLALPGLASGADTEKARFWHQWRGPLASGVSPTADPPLRWSETENVKWKVAIDGLGNSTPIIWGDRIFLTTAIDTGRVDPSVQPPQQQPQRLFGITFPNTFHQYVVICLDRASGEEVWRQVAAEQVPAEGHHADNSFATPSPTTDGERVYVWFGAAGLHCYDLDGGHIWSQDFGPAQTRLSFGEGSSPVVHGGRVMLVRDTEDQSFIVSLEANSGDIVWQVDRNEVSAWATPLVVSYKGQTQVITNSQNRVRSYRFEDGNLIWECGGQVSNVIPSPVATSDTVFCMSGYRGSALFAIPLDARGDVTGTEVIRWSKSRGTPYVPSPLLYGDLLYYTQSNEGILSCVDAATGKMVINRTRLPEPGSLYGSPVGAADRVYLVGRDGTALVIRHGREFEILATNELDDYFDASPALAGNAIFLRGKTHLYCVAAE